MRPAGFLVLAATALLSACSPHSGDKAREAANPATPGSAGAAGGSGPQAAPASSPTQVACTEYRADPAPDDMVMIYHAVSGLAPPIEKWAETILPKFDRQADPEGAWKQATDQIKAQYATVSTTRCVTLRTDLGARGYDPARGGVVLGALGQDTYYPFRALGEDVRLKIRNAEAASVWKLPADRAEALMRGSSNLAGASLVARLRIVSARPSSGDGVIEADVDSFDIMSAGDRTKLATVEAPGAH